MSLTVGTSIIAETRIQAVALRPVLGAYELIFALEMTIYPTAEMPMRAAIVGARVSVKGGGGNSHDIGFARPEQPIEVKQHNFQSRATPTLVLTLQPNQLAALEALRDTSNLDFDLLAFGTGVDANGEQQVQDKWRAHVPRSDWIKKLGDAGARNILLLEVPLPVNSASKEWADIAAGLQRAEEQYRNGDYHSCIGACRTVIQELGHHRFQKEKWAGGPLSRFASDRDGMTKAEREEAIWAILRHYTHQAHHGPSEGGVPDYTRAEAQFVLTLTAAAVAHAQAG